MREDVDEEFADAGFEEGAGFVEEVGVVFHVFEHFDAQDSVEVVLESGPGE